MLLIEFITSNVMRMRSESRCSRYTTLLSLVISFISLQSLFLFLHLSSQISFIYIFPFSSFFFFLLLLLSSSPLYTIHLFMYSHFPLIPDGMSYLVGQAQQLLISGYSPLIPVNTIDPVNHLNNLIIPNVFGSFSHVDALHRVDLV